jgi:hypothetical protein
MGAAEVGVEHDSDVTGTVTSARATISHHGFVIPISTGSSVGATLSAKKSAPPAAMTAWAAAPGWRSLLTSPSPRSARATEALIATGTASSATLPTHSRNDEPGVSWPIRSSIAVAMTIPSPIDSVASQATSAQVRSRRKPSIRVKATTNAAPRASTSSTFHQGSVKPANHTSIV